MEPTFLGVRHHSPTCARLVAATITRLKPAYVLIEGPVDMNDRLDELLLGHDLPIAIFSSYREGDHSHSSWAPLCEYSPEWVALTTGRAQGAVVRFIDLPAWHSALSGLANRYADADLRYAEVTERLCETFSVDNIDALWDHLFEAEDWANDADLSTRLTTYFEVARGDCPASEDDTTREAYMADQIAAAVAAAGDRPVVVVTGGFHRPALERLVSERVEAGRPADGHHPGWPEVPLPPEGALCGSFLVPYTFKRLDSFDGYQSGMPSPGYYQRLWDHGAAAAAEGIIEVVVQRLRHRKQAVSTVDLVAARAMAAGLARLRGHQCPARVDTLDGLVSALVTESLDVPLPWSARGQMVAGTHPAVVEMVAALSGDRTGHLHPDTPAPPLVAEVTAQLAVHDLSALGEKAELLRLDLTVDADRRRSRVLNRLRVLAIPGYHRRGGPTADGAAVLTEEWSQNPADGQWSALIEAGAYGATLVDAAIAVLGERIDASPGDTDQLAAVLFDATLCGLDTLSDQVLAVVAASMAVVGDLGGLGRILAVALGLWRHDHLLGTARSAILGTVISEGVTRALWLAEGVRGGGAPADIRRLTAVAAVRDAVRHAGGPLGLNSDATLDVMNRLCPDRGVPPDLRGAALGVCWSLGSLTDVHQVTAAVRGAGLPTELGDWLAGLFFLAREQVLAPGSDEGAGVLGVLDELVGDLGEHDFLVSLPALRQAFEFFPPRERDTIARRLLDVRGLVDSTRLLLRTGVDHSVLVRARVLEATVGELLTREGLLA